MTEVSYMYNILKNVQIVISLLKEYNIRHLVLSPGSRNVPFVHSVEQDSFFTCYSILDERGAGFFALGLAQQLDEPVLISCTSSTAASNYFPAVKEAADRNIQLVVLTADRNPYNRGQMENQMIDQINMYRSFCRKAVDLPTVTDKASFSYCERLVNEALLELNHNGTGPVQINFPAFIGFTDFSVQELPKCRKITRYYANSPVSVWKSIVQRLSNAKKIIFLFGEGSAYSEDVLKKLELVAMKYNVVISIEHMSNVYSPLALRTYPITECLSEEEVSDIVPEIIVTFKGNFSSSIKEKLRKFSDQFHHWRVASDGELLDTFKALDSIFECTDEEFFSKLLEYSSASSMPNTVERGLYLEKWKSRLREVKLPKERFSNFYVVKNVCESIPSGSLLHLSILNSIRMTNFFELSKNVKCYANIGAYGIDGSFSTFLGQAANTPKLSYLIIGDLSFLYDANALTIEEGIASNVRIIVINNRGGAEFYNNYMGHGIGDIGKHIAASHNSDIKSLVCNNNIEYLSARNNSELSYALKLMSEIENDKAIVLEVFTDIKTDAEVLREYYKINSNISLKTQIKNKIKALVGR